MSSLVLLETSSAAASYCPSLAIRSGTRRKRQFNLPSHNTLPLIKNKGLGPYCGISNLFLSSSRSGSYTFKNASSTISCTMDMTEGESVGPRKINFDHIMGEINKVLESLPLPVRRFPWTGALENFFELILGLVFAVAKYLCVPLLALTSLSELSYCGHERKMRLIPIPLLVGIAMAGIFRDTTLELYPQLKEGEFPWHLVAVASIFVLLKLPGPYYPYWGRIFIPHFANGGLLRILWCSVMWYRRSPTASETILQQGSTNDLQSQQEH